MNYNKEIEYKLLLSEEEFKSLLTKYSFTTYTQINYYFTSPELTEKHFSLRMREKNNTYEMTLKVPLEFGHDEYNIMITKEEFEIRHEQLPDNEITEYLIKEGINIGIITQDFSLKTIRHDYKDKYATLSLDENFYFDRHDYELEYEVTDEVKGYKDFLQFLQINHLSYTKNCDSKLKRVLDVKNSYDHDDIIL